MAEIKASSMITLMDISDIKLSSYMTANYPTTQIFDSNTNIYTPSWTALTLTPVVFVNDKSLSLSDSSLLIDFKRQDGTGSESALSAGETISGGKLTVNQNKLSASASGILTYICYITYTDPGSKMSVNAKNTLTFSLVRQGEKAHTVDITGEQLFKYDKGGALVSASQITLTATVQNVSISKWQFKNAIGVWTDYPTTSDNASITGATLIVKPAHAVFVNNTATLQVLTSDSNCYDVYSITKLYDGATGASGISPVTVLMTNEAEVFPATTAGAVSPAKTVTTVISAYSGTTAITPTVTLPSAPSGMTISQATSANRVTVTMTVADNASLGSNAALSGSLDFTIAAGGLSFLKTFSWTKSPRGTTGATGAAGANGADAIIFDCTFPNGSNVIANGTGTVAIGTVFYKGAALISSGVTYQWAKYAGGSWTNIPGATAASYTAQPADIISATSFRCSAAYDGKTYYAYATCFDKSDPYTCETFSSIGTMIKNGDGVGALYTRVWQGTKEADALKTTVFSTSAPASPASGDFYYKIDSSAKTVTLQKYNGSSWTAATGSDLPSLKYNWSVLDKNHNPQSTPTTWSTSKVVYIDASIIDEAISVYCDVE